ncbi:hypothetical protein AA23498_1109 [Acetobacter nitrogenifigens DSM 23921 = NBRC 105050]|uniref:Uncharacterized protein n=1 Tax=Acetobacter nitrogenifigens DSM 23921 = NBRC 105050 TaxID=1120919 RepID=A0A511XAM5_9PROT|nr:hypothetical protein [Acetobacter nitrogenifigens]GBQ91185.1 hypothetical protein AA23498_1109 [Acetobacter nitrogenifigens DSM 23921 = NBRC 105050]GEN59962.1 hypothetical protein ANI02nite_18460 [Acetobacter nitrogenifigens DSM 23921 = NBRC 105050]
MSHFNVFVTGEDIEEQLAPFQENNMGDCPPEYLTFCDCHDECVARWEEVDQNGVPHKERFRTFDRFVREFFGYRRHRDTGHYGYFENPDAKWDWYEIGGRWSGELMIRQEAAPDYQAIHRSPEGRILVDEARRGDIDFGAMERQACDAAMSRWQQTREIVQKTMSFDDLHAIRSWEDIRIEMQRKAGNIDEARTRYWEQKGLSELRQGLFDAQLWGWDTSPEGIAAMLSRKPEEYAADRARQSWLPFALLHEGEWIEKGRMSWFGIAVDELDNATWASRIRDLILGLPGDTRIAVVDCHI